jgi:hypothetical protein
LSRVVPRRLITRDSKEEEEEDNDKEELCSKYNFLFLL